jgi:ferric-dicitrate binding protein FerR (iron transport regulator)
MQERDIFTLFFFDHGKTTGKCNQGYSEKTAILKNKNIKDLMDRFIRNELTADELDILYNSINHSLHDKDILAWFYRYWDEAEKNNSHSKSKHQFDELRKKINLPEGPGGNYAPVKNPVRSQTKSIVIKVIQYAAILVLGYIIAVVYRKDNLIIPQSQNAGFHQITIPLGSKSKLTLPDETEIWLNSGSTIKYPAKFSTTRREVFLEGEAFFDVRRDESRPFFVRTSEINIRVLGTKFNVKSYPDEKFVETTVISGSVEIETKPAGSSSKQFLKLEPNQKATFSKAVQESELLKREEHPGKIKPKPVGRVYVNKTINTEIETAWKDNKLIFSRERFEDILIRLERWYDVDIVLEADNLRDYRYTGTFEKESLEQALEALKLTTPFEYSIDKNNIILNSIVK